MMDIIRTRNGDLEQAPEIWGPGEAGQQAVTLVWLPQRDDGELKNTPAWRYDQGSTIPGIPGPSQGHAFKLSILKR